MRKILLIIPLLIISGVSFSASFMNQTLLEETVKSIATNSKGENGVVKFIYNNVKMVLISDIKHDRMRIIAPIAKFNKLSRKQIEAAFISNFHKALDARYAVSNDVLYSAYIHPLSTLSENQIKSAMVQVSNLAATFGGEYSSGVLTFGGKKELKKRTVNDGSI